MKAELIINRNYVIGKIDPRLYGSFVEHIGRVVYDGIYEPEHPISDDMGFRRDVIDEVKKLGIPLVRYPGGNFVSQYKWEDGIGEKSKRPTRYNAAWNQIETNEIGIGEFTEWADRAQTDVMMTVNLGTRGVDSALECLEYCNLDTPTFLADKRRENGFDEPFGFKTWCLGNEMGGLGQICRKTPEEYGQLAAECAKAMKMTDPSIEIVICGSTHRKMPKFGEWELKVLDFAYKYADYLSIHQYYGPSDDPAVYFAKSVELDDYIKSIVAMCDSVKAIKGSKKTMMLAFDEWGIFGSGLISRAEKVEKAPHLFECIYTFEDALVLGMMMSVLQNNCDRIKIGCLAQLVNAIAPIMTEKGGRLWHQTVYYPFMLASQNGRGEAMRTVLNCDTYDTDEHKDVPYIESSVTHDPEKREITVFAVNRSMENDIELIPRFEAFGAVRHISHTELYSDDRMAKNSAECEAVFPVEVPVSEKTVLKKHSWNMLKYSY